jgi:hypothetical protein
MKYYRDYVLRDRDSTEGIWRFRDEITDASGNGHDLTYDTIPEPVFSIGHTEKDNTALTIPSGGKLTIAGANANDLNPGLQSFTIEAVLRCASGSSIGIVDKFDTTNGGYTMFTVSGTILMNTKDAIGNTGSGSSSFNVADGLWHYVVVSVDRENDDIRLYMDGVASTTNPNSISALTGNVAPADQDFLIGSSTDGFDIDELSVLIGEALTDLAVADRAAGRLNATMENNPDFMIQYLPAINQDNDALRQFLIPPSSLYLENRLRSLQLGNLMMWNVAPNKFLDHIADNLGFRLIPADVATESQRRKFLPWIFWMHDHKGTLAAIQKFLDLSGVTATIEELYSQWIPWKCNRDRTFKRSKYVETSFHDQFTDLLYWETPLAGTWTIVSDQLQGTGGGSDSATNAILHSNTAKNFYIETEFEITSGGGAGADFGIYLDYKTSTDWVRLEIGTDSFGNEFLYLVTSKSATVIKRMVGSLGSTTLDTGVHTLWAYGYYDEGHYTMGVDDNAVAVRTSVIPGSGFGGKKGLWVNDSLQVTFDDFKIETYDSELVPRIVSEHTNNKKVGIELVSAVDNEAERFAYVRSELPKLVPADVMIMWRIPVTDVPSLVTSGVDPTVVFGLYITPSAGTLVTSGVDPTVVLGSHTAIPEPGFLGTEAGLLSVLIQEAMIVRVRTSGPAALITSSFQPTIKIQDTFYFTPEPGYLLTGGLDPDVLVT